MSSTFVNEISRVFNWQVADNNSSINIEGCNTSVLHDINKVSDCNNTLKSLRKDNLNKLIFAHLNINSIQNKFELLSEQIKGNVLMISETKIDDSFPVGQFLKKGSVYHIGLIVTRKVEALFYMLRKKFLQT